MTHEEMLERSVAMLDRALARYDKSMVKWRGLRKELKNAPLWDLKRLQRDEFNAERAKNQRATAVAKEAGFLRYLQKKKA